jgi:Holliday junction DNA helicase RuvB
METGIVTETKYNRTRKMEIETSVFATSNNVERVIEPLQSRFFIVKLQAYTYEQFNEITVRLLTSDKYNVDEEIAQATAEAVWRTSKNIRDAIKITKMAKSVEGVDWLITTFLKGDTTHRAIPAQPSIFSNKCPEHGKNLGRNRTFV